MPILIALAIFVFVTAAMMALLQARSAPALVAQSRLDQAAGKLDFAVWQGRRLVLRANRMSSIGWLGNLLSEVNFAKDIELLLIKADWNLRVSEFLTFSALSGLIGFVVANLFLGNVLFALLVVPVGLMFPLLFLHLAAKRRIKKMEKQLVEFLVMMSNALKGGFGLMQAIDQAARHLERPIADELHQLLRDTQVGSSVEEAVTNLGKRIGSYDLDIVITAILVQRNVGGNLSEILDSVAHTIRERDRIKGEISTLTGQQKLTGMIIAALPLGLAVVFTLLNGEYMSLLWTETLGRIMIAGAIVMEVIGALVIRKITNIEV